MTKEQEQVFIVDDEMKNFIRKDPEFAPLKKALAESDFRVVCFDEKSNVELYDKNMAKPIDKYQGIAIKSDLYDSDRVFYPLLDYDEERLHSMLDFYDSYLYHLNELMQELASYMGACKWEFSFIEETFKSSTQSYGSGGGADGKYIDKESKVEVSAGASYGNANKSLNSSGAKFEYQKSEVLVNRKKSPQELEKFIKEQGINLNAFGRAFKKQIEDYIKGETIGTTHEMFDKSECSVVYNKTIKKISASVSILKFFTAKFKYDLVDEIKNESKQRKKLFYRMTFDDKKSHSKT